jgi:hypothetical protein
MQFSRNSPINNLCVYGQRTEETIPSEYACSFDIGRGETGGYSSTVGRVARVHRGPFVNSNYLRNHMPAMADPYGGREGYAGSRESCCGSRESMDAMCGSRYGMMNNAAADRTENATQLDTELDPIGTRGYSFSRAFIERYSSQSPEYSFDDGDEADNMFSSHDSGLMMAVERAGGSNMASRRSMTGRSTNKREEYRDKEMLEILGVGEDCEASYIPGGCCGRTRLRRNSPISALRNSEFENIIRPPH